MDELKITDLMLKHKINCDLIRNFMTNTNKTGKINQTKGFLQVRITLLEKYWITFENTNDAIIMRTEAEAAEFKDSNTYNDIESIFTVTLGMLSDSLSALQPIQALEHADVAAAVNGNGNANGQQQGAKNVNVKLPAIAIPKFAGDFTHWTSFHDLFDSLVVKNTSLSNVNKLHHLKSALSGEAELVLRQFAIEENNFEPAWALLRRRFANKRMLVNAQFARLLSQQK